MKEKERRGKNIGERGDARFLYQFFFLLSPPMVVPLPPPGAREKIQAGEIYGEKTEIGK